MSITLVTPETQINKPVLDISRRYNAVTQEYEGYINGEIVIECASESAFNRLFAEAIRAEADHMRRCPTDYLPEDYYGLEAVA